ncbi:acyltransferase [Ferrimonas balearica]|uniref:acyltransferase n=1 Tax=Ferrimonas balearica TaxID=44012 RepID=UPI001C55ECC6|nr:acyltransferase [Ferrimonas balearica]MBW3141453.1 acyltransferase [Ferrimonas balearica]MBY6108497.1 acyltransferase [Ferrimonas balearica]
MLSFLPAPILAPLNAVLACLSVLFWGGLIILLAPIKLLPIPALRRQISALCNACMHGWVATNYGVLRLTTKTRWEVDGLSESQLSKQGWYLVLANHLSWADIVVVTVVLRNQVPMLKFFLKQQLLYVPVMGLACWALDMPFMRRYTKSQIARNPALKGKDIETTRRSCEKFKDLPTCVINFVEGSRLTRTKHQRQRSPFRYLMKPKAGGIAFALNTLGSQFDQLLDVTIVYPDAPENIMWALLQGKLDRIHVSVRTLPMSEVPVGDYDSDKAYRVTFQHWLNGLWLEKDRTIANVINQQQAPAPFYQELEPTGQAEPR